MKISVTLPERLEQEAASLEVTPEVYVTMLITKDLVRVKNLDRVKPKERQRAEVGRPRLSARTKAVREAVGKLEGIYLKRQELMGGTLSTELAEQLQQIRQAAAVEDLEELQRIEKLQPWTKGGGRNDQGNVSQLSSFVCTPRAHGVGAIEDRLSELWSGDAASDSGDIAETDPTGAADAGGGGSGGNSVAVSRLHAVPIDVRQHGNGSTDLGDD